MCHECQEGSKAEKAFMAYPRACAGGTDACPGAACLDGTCAVAESIQAQVVAFKKEVAAAVKELDFVPTKKERKAIARRILDGRARAFVQRRADFQHTVNQQHAGVKYREAEREARVSVHPERVHKSLRNAVPVLRTYAAHYALKTAQKGSYDTDLEWLQPNEIMLKIDYASRLPVCCSPPLCLRACVALR